MFISSVGLCIGRVDVWDERTGFIALEYFWCVDLVGGGCPAWTHCPICKLEVQGIAIRAVNTFAKIVSHIV